MDGLDYELVDITAAAKADFLFGGVDIDIYFSWIHLQMDKACGAFSLHQKTAKPLCYTVASILSFTERPLTRILMRADPWTAWSGGTRKPRRRGREVPGSEWLISMKSPE